MNAPRTLMGLAQQELVCQITVLHDLRGNSRRCRRTIYNATLTSADLRSWESTHTMEVSLSTTTSIAELADVYEGTKDNNHMEGVNGTIKEEILIAIKELLLYLDFHNWRAGRVVVVVQRGVTSLLIEV